jgi:anhydro-N-acetylmuramic acid kinase
MARYFIGVMSGTSLDAIDVVIVDFDKDALQILITLSYPWEKKLQNALLALQLNDTISLSYLAQLDVLCAIEFAHACLAILKNANLTPQEIVAIASHGQTIGHWPQHKPATTFQIGDPNTIAAMTGITTVADFRRRDLALGGQGAPLTPAFHHYFFATDDKTRIVLNIGGIANLTLLHKKNLQPVMGFDSGPGNGLMDAWIKRCKHLNCDPNGAWAKCGLVNQNLLNALLTDPFFQASPPKSTGREYFNLNWLNHYLAKFNHCIEEVDIQATLLALTVESIAQEIEKLQLKQACEILVCGGGIHNLALMEKLTTRLTSYKIVSTAQYGLHPDWVEATAFAWLGKQCIDGQNSNIPSVTGAKKTAILGGIYQA